MTVRGHSGELKHGYRVAARLSAWFYTGGKDGQPSTIDATPMDANAHELSSGGPFDVVLDVGKQQWIWRGVTPTVADGSRFAATVSGRPEIRV